MRKLRSSLTYANVMATLAFLIAVAGGTAYAANTIGSADVIDNSLLSADLANNKAVKSADVANGTLDDEDLGLTVVNFVGSIGTVPANDCVDRDVTGIAAGGDHLVLTPARSDSWGKLIYTAEYSQPGDQSALILVCNPTGSAVDDGTTHFNLLVIDAQ